MHGFPLIPRAPGPRPADLLTVADSPWRGFLLGENEGIEVQICNTVGFWLKSVFQSSLSSLSSLWCDAFQHIQSKSELWKLWLGCDINGDMLNRSWQHVETAAFSPWPGRCKMVWWSHGCTAGRPNSQSDLGFSNRVLLKSSISP